MNGQPDNGAHPFVGELLFYVPDAVDSRFTDPGGWFTCTGTLVSPTVVMTAGHCAYGIGDDGQPTTGSNGNDVWINFSEVPDFDVISPSGDYIPDRNERALHRPQGRAQRRPELARGHRDAHPEYNDNAFYLHDLGVLVLDKPVQSDTYGELPKLGLLDTLVKKKSKILFGAVGYGLEGSKLASSFGGDTRRTANQRLVSLNGASGIGKGISAKFSSNKGINTTGGTCFGDSGGPIFLGGTTTIVAVTSYGISPTCADGTGGYRVDQTDDLDFMADFGVTP